MDEHGPHPDPTASAAAPGRRRGLRLVVGIVAAGLLVALTDPGVVLARLADLDPAWVAAAVGVQLLGKLVWAWRWRLVLGLVGLRARFVRLVQGLLVGMFFGNVLPTSFGGDLVRGWWILDERGDYGRSLFAVFVERFVGFACLGWVALPAALLLLARRPVPEVPWLLASVVALSGAVLLLSPAVFSRAGRLLLPGRRLAPARERVLRVLAALRERRGARWGVYGLSVAVHLVGVAYYFAIGRALGLPLEAWHYLVLVPLTTVATGFPVTFNGLGAREGALVLLLQALDVGVGAAEAVSLGLAAFAVNLVVSLLGGAAYLLGDRSRVPAAPPPRAVEAEGA